MPVCPMCEKPASSAELIELAENGLACGECRRPKPMEDEMKEQTEQRALSKRSVFSLNVAQVKTRNGDKDYLIEAGIKSGAVNFQFEATVDQIREFFTERRERAALEGVKVK